MIAKRWYWLFAFTATFAIVLGFKFLFPTDLDQRHHQASNDSDDKSSHRAVSISSMAPKPQPVDQDFVGSEVCARCHASVASIYRTHPMSRSLTSVRHLDHSEGQLSDALVEPLGPRKYQSRWDSERLWHHEALATSAGETVYDQAIEVHFALGSGTRGRAFLSEREGRLFASPLNWYSQAGHWGLAPGYSAEHHKRFERETGDGCLVCHAGRVNSVEDHPNVYASPVFHEMSIGCERCHGPGQRHVDFQTARASATQPAETSDPIVNPAKLDADRREDVCNQCHLQGQMQFLRTGRQTFDFRPGMRLDDVWLIFVAEDRSGAGKQKRAVSQVEQMRSSLCFLRSDGRMGCSSCHDAHSVPTPAEKEDHYRQRCLTCHATQDCQVDESKRLPSKDSCVSCHMPRLNADDVPHTSQTDHRIVRTPDSTPTDIQSSPEVDQWELFNQAEGRLTEWERHRARGLMLASLAEKTGSKQFATDAEALLVSASRVARDDVEIHEALGVCAFVQGQVQEAQTIWKSALHRAPSRESLLARLAFMSHNNGDLSGAAKYFERLLKINPCQSDFHGRYAHVLGSLGQLPQAIQAAERATEINPTLSQAHDWLAKAYRFSGKPEKSTLHQSTATKLRNAGF